jgi:hypothetical protein
VRATLMAQGAGSTTGQAPRFLSPGGVWACWNSSSTNDRLSALDGGSLPRQPAEVNRRDSATSSNSPSLGRPVMRAHVPRADVSIRARMSRSVGTATVDRAGGSRSISKLLRVSFRQGLSVSGRDHFLDPRQPGHRVREADCRQGEQTDMADLVRGQTAAQPPAGGNRPTLASRELSTARTA